MSIVNNSLLFAGDEGYSIARSVRLRSSATAYLNRAPASASNRQTWTFSCWLKRGTLTTRQALMGGYTGTTNGTLRTQIIILDGGTLQIGSDQMQTATDFNIETTQVFRDPSAWYHIVVAMDTTQATSTNRIKLYVNGVQVTSLSNTTYPSLNYQGGINYNNNQYINRFYDPSGGNYYGDGYLTEINFIDGQALTPSSFGETDSITGVWKAKKYGGTYGTNGFYLNFSDNSSNTATTIGKDYSGNGNNWTPNNISVTANATYDSMVDTPTVGSLSSNYATWNPLDINAGLSTANGNLSVGTGGATSTHRLARSTIGFTTKTYFEITTSGGSTGMVCMIGAGQATANPADGTYVGGYGKSFGLGYATTSSNFYLSGVSLANGSATNLVDGTWAFAVDPANGKAWVRNTSGSWIGGGDPATDTSPTLTWTSDGLPWFPATSFYNITNTYSVVLNCGQRPFSYTPPTGFVALNTYNLPASTIKNGAAYMAATVYSGNSPSSQTVSNAVNGFSFQPDLVWQKSRTQTYSNVLYDSVRGVQKRLSSNETAAESTASTAVTAFTSSGFTTGADGEMNDPTGGSNNHVAWQWKAGGTSASNTNGSITSTVSVGATQGFSVVTYTGNGTNGATVGHGLGVAPSMMIFFDRNTAGRGHFTYHISTGANGYMFLDSNSAFVSGNTTMLNGTTPSSSLITLGTNACTNFNTETYVAYCFAAVAGYSAFGSYTGNGSTDGPFVYLGFRPRYVLIKSTAVEHWMVEDSSRNTHNVIDAALFPALSNAESTANANLNIDFLSNGFKVRSAGATINNTNGQAYIYAAFAENPTKYALAR